MGRRSPTTDFSTEYVQGDSGTASGGVTYAIGPDSLRDCLSLECEVDYFVKIITKYGFPQMRFAAVTG